MKISEDYITNLPLYSNQKKKIKSDEVIFSDPVSILDLSLRFQNCLYQLKIKSIEELISLTPYQLLRIRNCGKKSVNEIQEKAKKYLLNYVDEKIIKIIKNNKIVTEEGFKKEVISEEYLNELPLFSNDALYGKVELHASYKPMDSMDNINLKIRSINCLSQLRIINISELLFLSPSKLSHIKNCGKNTIKDFQESVKKYLLYQEADYKSLNELLRHYQFNQKKTDIFLLHIGVGQDQFPTLQTIGEKYNCSRERIRQIVSNCIDFFQKVYQNHELDDFYIPLELILDTYKGAICFESIKEDLSDLLDWDIDIEVHSYIRFWVEVSKNIEYDKKKKIFWEKNNECINCEYCKNFFTNITINNKDTLLQKLEEYCTHEIGCKYEKEKEFDKGLILFYLDEKVLKEKKKQHQEKQLRIDIDYVALCCKHKLKIDEKQEILLEQLKKKKGIISGVRLDSLSPSVPR